MAAATGRKTITQKTGRIFHHAATFAACFFKTRTDKTALGLASGLRSASAVTSGSGGLGAPTGG